MNLVLFEEDELNRNLSYDDPRAVHISMILRLDEGDVFAAGVIGGSRGRARLVSRETSGWKWTFTPMENAPPLHPLTLILGCPRPPVARRLLKDMATLGLCEIRVCSTDLNEKSYLASRLWREKLWRHALLDGASQGGSTMIPVVRTGPDLRHALKNLPLKAERIAFDNDTGLSAFETWNLNPDYRNVILAVGPERGWSNREREQLESLEFLRLHLGKRILRTETACTAGVALILSRIRSLKGT